MEEVTIQDALEYCLANPDGLGVEELLAKFPRFRAELEPMLALSSRIESVAPPPVPAERMASMKARLMDAAAAQRETMQSASERPAERAVVQSGRKPGWIWAVLRRPAFVAGSVAALLIAAVWWGAAGALPDSPFYSIKLASENFMLNFAGGTAEKARAHLNLASARLDEMVQMNGQGKLAASAGAVQNYDYHMNQCATLWKQTTGQAYEDIKAGISASVNRCEKTFTGFGASVASLPGPVKEDVQRLYARLSGIRVEIGEPPDIELPEGITISVVTNPTPGAEATVSATVPVSLESATAQPTSAGIGTATAERTVTTGATETVGVETATGTAVSRNASATAIPRVGTPRPASTSLATATYTAISINTPNLPPIVRGTPSAIPSTKETTTATHTSTSTASPTATNTAIPQPTVEVSPTIFTDLVPTKVLPAPVPPQETPVPPTEIAPTITVAPPSDTPMPATPETEPTTVACALRIEELDIGSCEDGEEISWDAKIENEGGTSQGGNWEAVLLVKLRNGPYQEVESISGDVTLQPHSNRSIGDSFDYNLPPDAEAVRVELALSSNGVRCDRATTQKTDCDDGDN